MTGTLTLGGPLGVLPLGTLDPAHAAATDDPFAGLFDDPGAVLDFLIEIEFRPEQTP
jgi:hypothetical protein